MLKSEFWLTFFIGVMTMSAQAASIGGSGVVDGGHGVSCRNGGHQSVQTLDLFEAAMLGALDRKTFDAAVSGADGFTGYESALQILVDRASAALGASHPFVRSFATQVDLVLRSATTSISSGTSMSSFPTTYDDGLMDVLLPKNCALVQLAFRNKHGGRSDVVFNPELTSELSSIDRLVLVSHEALHVWFQPAGNTRTVRLANRYLFATDEFRQRNFSRFVELINERKEQDFRKFTKE